MQSDNYEPTKDIGNGVTVNFTYTYDILAEANIRVYLELISTGVQTLQTNGSDYTLVWTSSGGTVTFASAPSSLYYVIIARDIPNTQDVAYKTSSGIQAAVLEDSLDELTAQVQDLREELDRALKSPLGSGLSIIVPVPEADKVLVGNAAEDGYDNQTLDQTDTGAIADGAITTAKLDADAVTGAKIADDAVDSEHIAAGAIDTEHIADNQVTSAKLEDDLAFGTFPTTPESAPDADYEVANKKYVDDLGISLGTSVSRSNNTIYQAATDGFFIGVLVLGDDSSGGRIKCSSDANSSPTTLVASCSGARFFSGASQSAYLSTDSFCFPVKSGNYYKGVLESTGTGVTATYYWIPLS